MTTAKVTRTAKKKKKKGLDLQNNNFAQTSRFFVYFFVVVARLPRETASFHVLSRTGTQDKNFLVVGSPRFSLAALRLKFSSMSHNAPFFMCKPKVSSLAELSSGFNRLGTRLRHRRQRGTCMWTGTTVS